MGCWFNDLPPIIGQQAPQKPSRHPRRIVARPGRLGPQGRFTGVRAPCLAAEDSHTVRRASCRKSARDVLWEPEAGDRLRRPGRGGGDITSLPDPLSARDGAKDGARVLAGGWGGARRLEADRDSVFGGRIGGLPAGRRVLIEEPNPLPHPGDGPRSESFEGSGRFIRCRTPVARSDSGSRAPIQLFQRHLVEVSGCVVLDVVGRRILLALRPFPIGGPSAVTDR